MDPIRSFCGKLRTLASTLDGETARLQRALDGEESGECGRAFDSVGRGSLRRGLTAGGKERTDPGEPGPRGAGGGAAPVTRSAFVN
jgi:hypothetical protein